MRLIDGIKIWKIYCFTFFVHKWTYTTDWLKMQQITSSFTHRTLVSSSMRRNTYCKRQDETIVDTAFSNVTHRATEITESIITGKSLENEPLRTNIWYSMRHAIDSRDSRRLLSVKRTGDDESRSVRRTDISMVSTSSVTTTTQIMLFIYDPRKSRFVADETDEIPIQSLYGW